MNAKPLNLLRYPRRMPSASPVLLKHALVCGLLGAVVGAAVVAWLQHRQAQLHEQRQQLQMQAQALAKQRAEDTAQLERTRVQEQGGVRARAWGAQRAHLARVNAALTALADEAGLRLTRWQGDGRKLVLQGSLPQVQDLPLVLSRLSDAWPVAWTLHSLGDRQPAGTGVEWVIEAPWPQASADPPRRQP